MPHRPRSAWRSTPAQPLPTPPAAGPHLLPGLLLALLPPWRLRHPHQRLATLRCRRACTAVELSALSGRTLGARACRSHISALTSVALLSDVSTRWPPASRASRTSWRIRRYHGPLTTRPGTAPLETRPGTAHCRTGILCTCCISHLHRAGLFACAGQGALQLLTQRLRSGCCTLPFPLCYSPFRCARTRCCRVRAWRCWRRCSCAMCQRRYAPLMELNMCGPHGVPTGSGQL